MRKVTCYECGKRYDYDDDGFCPGCGAFNAPASASRIAADGSVVWIDGINERNHENSFLHEELHEEDRERRWWGLDQKPAAQVVRLGKAGKPTLVRAVKTGGKKKVPGFLWLILALVLGMNVLLPLIATLVYW